MRDCCRLPPRVCLCLAVCTLCSVLLGYDVGIMTGAKLKIRQYFDLNDSETEVMVGILQIMAAFGGIMTGSLSDYIGRKRTLGVAAFIFIVGAMVMALAQSYAAIVVGRIVTGLGVGTGIMIGPLYTSEISPPSIRGSIVSLSEISLNGGILLGYVSSYAFADLSLDVGWRWMLGIGAIPAAIVLLSLPALDESPHWLSRQASKVALLPSIALTETTTSEHLPDNSFPSVSETNLDECENARLLPATANEVIRRPDIQETHSKSSGSESDDWVDVMASPTLSPSPSRSPVVHVKSFHVPVEIQGNENLQSMTPAADEGSAHDDNEPLVQPVSRSPSSSSSPKLTSPPSRRQLLVAGIGTAFLQQTVGVEAMVYYTPEILRSLGLESFRSLLLATMAVGAFKVSFIFVAIILLDRVGRRALLITSALGMAAAHSLMGINFLLGNEVYVAVIGLCFFMASFSSGYGPATWVVAAEIFPLAIRGTAMGVATFANRLTSGLVAISFLSLQNALTPAGIFFLFASLSTLAAVFTFRCVPETNGLSLEEIEHGRRNEESNQ